MKRFNLLALGAGLLFLSSLAGCAIDTVDDPNEIDEQGYELDVQPGAEQPAGEGSGPAQPGQPVDTHEPPNGGPTPYPWTVPQSEPNDPKDPTPYPWLGEGAGSPTGSGTESGGTTATKDTAGSGNTTH